MGRGRGLGAGTGQFAVQAVRRFGRVIAVDVSPAMVAALRARADAEGLDNLTAERGGFLSFDPGERRLYGAYTCVKPG